MMALAQIQQGFDSYVMSRDPSSATTSVCAASSTVLSQLRGDDPDVAAAFLPHPVPAMQSTCDHNLKIQLEQLRCVLVLFSSKLLSISVSRVLVHFFFFETYWCNFHNTSRHSTTEH